MSNVLFPDLPGLEWGAAWYPTFHTMIQTAASGKEYRSSLQANPTYVIELNYEFIRHGAKQELRQLVGFFMARRGSFDNFLFRLDDDCSVTGQLVGTGDGATRSFQLVRAFGEFVEPVQNIDQVLKVQIGGVDCAPSDYTVSDTGLLTFGNAPGPLPITWSGSYFYRARFTADVQEFDRFMQNLWSAQTVSLTGTLGTRI